MRGWGRWRVRDAFGARWTFVLSTHASADERTRALPERAAQWAVERTFARPRDEDQHLLVEMAGVAAVDARRFPRERLKTLVKRRVGPLGPLLVLGDSASSWAAQRDGVTAAPTPDMRVIATIMGRRQTIAFEGREYRVATTSGWKKVGQDDFVVVGTDEARAVMSRLGSSPHVTAAQREALDDAAARLVERAQFHVPGGLILLRRVVRASFIAPLSEPATTPSAMRAAAKKDIALRFVEVGTGRPLAGAVVKLAAPDGNENRLTTASDGSVKLTGLDPGRCIATSVIENATADASFVPGASGLVPASDGDGDRDTSAIQPSYLVEVDEYRVKTGDTTDSIAQDAGLPWDDIAQFNWNTTDPDELQEIFHNRVGCTKTSPDGKRYVFDERDEPGIILIPRPWTGSFSVGMAHTVLVAPLRSVSIALENELGVAVPGAGYEVVFADGSVRRGQLGRSGIARLAGVPEGPFSVAYPDQDDLLARSLAASTRRAFDEQGTGPLFFLLGQDQSIIDKAVSVYEEYFNDLSGEGLVGDIDQVVTDEDARPPLVFLCALAGLPIEGTNGVTVEDAAAGGSDDG